MADMICAFLEGGYDRIESLTLDHLPDQSQITFTAGLCEDLKTSEGVGVLLRLAQAISPLEPHTIESAVRIGESLNLILSFDNAPRIDEQTEDKVRQFLHECLQQELTAPQTAVVCYALRGVGDEESIKQIQAQPKLDGTWKGTESSVIRAIRKRVKS